MILIGDIPNDDMNLRYQKYKGLPKTSKIFDKKRENNMTDLEKNFFQQKIK